MKLKNVNVELLNEVLREMNADFSAEETVVDKPEETLEGFILKSEDSNISPTVYIAGYPDYMTEGELAAELMNIYKTHSLSIGPDVIGDLMTRDNILNTVLPRLTNAKNVDRLTSADTVYTGFLDLAVIYYIPVSAGIYNGAITLKNPHLEYARINKTELHKHAIKNLEKEFHYESMFDCLSRMVDGAPYEDDGTTPAMYVMSNNRMCHGASVILTQKFKDTVKMLFGEKGAVVIPSSIHEVLVVDNNDDVIGMSNIIKEVNETKVSANEVLSDHPYFATPSGISLDPIK